MLGGRVVSYVTIAMVAQSAAGIGGKYGSDLRRISRDSGYSLTVYGGI
jgi:hypothetical protein